MDQDGVLMSDFMLKLTDGFQKRLAFHISDRPAYFDNGNVRVFRGKIPVKTAFDLVGNMRNYLNCPASVIAPAFFLQHGPIYFSSGDIGIFS